MRAYFSRRPCRPRPHALAAAATLLLASLTAAATARAEIISGRVVGPDGAPVAGATVYAVHKPDWRLGGFAGAAAAAAAPKEPEIAPVTTGSDGVFHVDLPGPMSPEYIARPGTVGKDGPPYGYVTVVAKGYGLAQRPVYKNAAANAVPLSVATGLAGTVTDEAGKPVSGVTVALFYWQRAPLDVYTPPGPDNPMLEEAYCPPSLGRSALTATTDGKGEWRLDGLPANGFGYLFLLPGEVWSQSQQKVALKAVKDEDAAARKSGGAPLVQAGIKLTAHRAVSVTGSVVGPDNKPVPGAHITAITAAGRGDEDGGAAAVNAIAGPDGAFTLRGVRAGRIHVHASAPEASAAGDASKVTDDTAPPPLVESADGGASVESVTGKPIVLSAPLRLVRAVAVTGTVVDAQTGKGVKDVVIGIQADTAGDFFPFTVDNGYRTDADGHFRILTAPGTAFHIDLDGTEAGYQPIPPGEPISIVAPAAAVADGQAAPPSPPLALKMQRAWSFSGTVADTDGKPVPGVRVHFEEAGSQEWEGNWDREQAGPEKSDADGKWRVPALSANKDGYQIHVPAGWELVSPKADQVFRPDAGAFAVENVAVVVRKRTTRILTGSVVDTHGAPIPAARLNLLAMRPAVPAQYPGQQIGRDLDAATDARGAYTFSGILTEEKVTVGLNAAQGYRYRSGGVVTEANGALDITPLVLVKLDGKLSGKVVDAHGKPVAGARVWSTDGAVSRGGSVATTGADGAFRLSNLPTGETVNVSAARGKVWAQASARAGETAVVLTLPSAPDAAPEPRALLDDLVAQQKGQPNVDRSFLTDFVAGIDPDAAWALAQSAHKGGETLPDGVVANLIEARLKTSPREAARWAESRYANVGEPMVRVRIACEIGLALAPLDPAGAARWYAMTRADAEQPNAAVDVNRARLVALAALLHNSTDEASHLARLNKALAENTSDEWLGERCALEVSRGDIAAAEKLAAAFPVDHRTNFYSELITRVVKTSPTTARQLIPKLLALVSSPEVADDYWRRQEAVLSVRRVVAGLGPNDPPGALELARTVPKTHEGYMLVLAEAARFQSPAVAESIWKAAREWAGVNQWEAPIRWAQLAQATAGAGATPQAAETARSFWAESVRAVETQQGGYLNQSDGWSIIAASFDPAAARAELERYYAELGSAPPARVSRWQMAQAATAMCLVDPARAEALLDSLPEPSPEEKKQMSGANSSRDYAVENARLSILRILRLPPEQRRRLTQNAIYGYNGEQIED